MKTRKNGQIRPVVPKKLGPRVLVFDEGVPAKFRRNQEDVRLDAEIVGKLRATGGRVLFPDEMVL